jgi:hypothetical protein
MEHHMTVRPDQVAWRRLIERWNEDERAFSATVGSEDGALITRASADPDLELVAAVHSHWGRSTLVFRLPGIGEHPADRRDTQAWVLIDDLADDPSAHGFAKADSLEGLARMLERLEPFGADSTEVSEQVAGEQ